jgi:hypothetical protein
LGTFGFAILFGLVVVLGYIPGLNAPMHHHHAGADPGEHMLLGRYAISLLDDVTHGLTALLLFAAALHSARVSRIALAVFGSYYAVDAAIYIITGLLQRDPIGSNLALNLPHVVLSSAMLWLAYSRARTAELKVASPRIGAPQA